MESLRHGKRSFSLASATGVSEGRTAGGGRVPDWLGKELEKWRLEPEASPCRYSGGSHYLGLGFVAESATGP